MPAKVGIQSPSARLHCSLGRKKCPGHAVVVLAAGAGAGRHPAPLLQIRVVGQGIILAPSLHHRAVGQVLHVFPAALTLAHRAIGQHKARFGLQGGSQL